MKYAERKSLLCTFRCRTSVDLLWAYGDYNMTSNKSATGG